MPIKYYFSQYKPKDQERVWVDSLWYNPFLAVYDKEIDIFFKGKLEVMDVIKWWRRKISIST